MNPYDRAHELAETEIPDLLVAAGITDVLVTTDLLAIPAALNLGPVVLVQPPELTFVTYTLVEAKWELGVIAGPTHDKDAAWKVIQPIMDALREPLSLDTAYPSSFSHPSMPDHPAYELIFTEAL